MLLSQWRCGHSRQIGHHGGHTRVQHKWCVCVLSLHQNLATKNYYVEHLSIDVAKCCTRLDAVCSLIINSPDAYRFCATEFHSLYSGMFCKRIMFSLILLFFLRHESAFQQRRIIEQLQIYVAICCNEECYWEHFGVDVSKGRIRLRTNVFRSYYVERSSHGDIGS